MKPSGSDRWGLDVQSKPRAGIRVLESGGYIAGPYATSPVDEPQWHRRQGSFGTPHDDRSPTQLVNHGGADHG
jgi:hypothetical protein